MSAPILLFLLLLSLLLVGLSLCGRLLPLVFACLATMAAAALGLLLCLVPIALRLPPATLVLPAGPPGLSTHLALDALSAYVLVLVMAAATAIAAVAAQTAPSHAAAPNTADAVPPILRQGAIRRLCLCLAGTILLLLAADAVTLSIGLAIACAAVWLGGTRRRAAALLVPFLLLAAVILLTPAGYPPRFDAIRTAPPGVLHASVATCLTVAAVTLLLVMPVPPRAAERDALVSGLIIPAGLYVLLRLVADLPGASAQPFWGFLLMISGSVLAVRQSWRAAEAPNLDGITGGLVRGQAGLAMIGLGVTVLSRLADLPTAAGDALAGTLLLSAAVPLAGTLVSLAAQAMTASAGTARLSRLGGLVQLMPATSAALGVGLFAGSALPCSVGFASLWLLLRALLSAPRAGGLSETVPLALTAAAIALTAVVSSTAALRLACVAVLSRPRSPRGAGAGELAGPTHGALLTLAAISGILGLLPGSALALLAAPVLHDLTGVEATVRGGPFGTGPGYLALPTAALFGLALGTVLVVRRWRPREIRVASPWADGQQAPRGLPFGDPLAQSTGRGFLPRLPRPPDLRHWAVLPARRRPADPLSPGQHTPDLIPLRLPRWRVSSGRLGLWLLLAAVSACLTILAITGNPG